MQDEKERVMRRIVLLSSLALVVLAGCSMKGKAKPANLSKMTCEEFLSLSDDVQPRAVAWMDGYSRGKLRQQDVGEVDVDRQMESLVVLCEQTPTQSFWERVRAHLPGGSRRSSRPR
jgi:acid stress chaperone HdeA